MAGYPGFFPGGEGQAGQQFVGQAGALALHVDAHFGGARQRDEQPVSRMRKVEAQIDRRGGGQRGLALRTDGKDQRRRRAAKCDGQQVAQHTMCQHMALAVGLEVEAVGPVALGGIEQRLAFAPVRG